MTPNIPLILTPSSTNTPSRGAATTASATGPGCWRTASDWPRRPGRTSRWCSLFAVLHDSRRVSEATDPDHGPRAAEFARSLRGRLFDLPDHEFRLLHRACAGHTHERTHPDVTIQTCWDADRLDLGRVGITPHPSRLCTEAARRPETIRWADGRASFLVIPEFVRGDWGIDLRPGD